MSNPYETDALLNQYLGFHYGPDYFGVPNYAAQCATLCLRLPVFRHQRALDLGCAVGRSSFELARTFKQVVGIDLSARFVGAAQQLQAGETLHYFEHDEGELGHKASASLAVLGLQELASKVIFEQGDACNLGPEHTDFDLIFAGNLIDRVADPAAFLRDMARRVSAGGLLVISSPYTLLTEYTPRENWVGGFEVDGKPVRMLDGMARHLQPAFTLLQAPTDVPFVIRETARKFQHSIAQLSVWKRAG